jgi:hypothetical protein
VTAAAILHARRNDLVALRGLADSLTPAELAEAVDELGDQLCLAIEDDSTRPTVAQLRRALVILAEIHAGWSRASTDELQANALEMAAEQAGDRDA